MIHRWEEMRCVKYSVKRAERKETDGSPDGRLGPDELSRHLCHCFFHLVEKLQKILCASSLSGRDFLAVSVSSTGKEAELGNPGVRAPPDPFYLDDDEHDGIRRGWDRLDHKRDIVSLESELESSLLHHIVEKWFRLFGTVASSLIFKCLSSRSARVRVQRIWFSLIFSIFISSLPTCK